MSVTRGHEDYRLERDLTASVRLNAQHYLWKDVVGFNLHPETNVSTGASLKVADLGTGTGIWALDVAQHNPTVHVDGFDMRLGQCPPAEMWPKNAAFYAYNFTQDVPSEFQNKYDVLHVRLVMGGLQDTPAPALKNFFKMLKPGGYLQWQELNPHTVTVATSNSSLEHTAMDELADKVRHFELGKWVSSLASFCSENGFVEARTHKYSIPSSIAIPFIETQLMALEEISRVAMNNSEPEATGPQFRALIGRAKNELYSGVWLAFCVEVTLARKPMKEI